MEPPRFSVDYCSVTAFRAQAARVLSAMSARGRPVVLTQHGQLTAIVLPVTMYEAILDEMTLLRDVRAAEGELEQSPGTPNLALRRAMLGLDDDDA